MQVGQCQSSEAYWLSSHAQSWSINENLLGVGCLCRYSFLVDDVHYDADFAVVFSEVDVGDSAGFNEFLEPLWDGCTILTIRSFYQL